MKRRGTPNDRSHRRATVLMIVLIALLIIVGMASSLFRLAVLHHGQSRRFEMQAQADWLAREGARRAAARLAEDRDFPGDTWRVTLDTLGPIQVVTQVTTPTSRESTRGISSHVRLAPDFLRTPVHGHATTTLSPKHGSTRNTQ